MTQLIGQPLLNPYSNFEKKRENRPSHQENPYSNKNKLTLNKNYTLNELRKPIQR